MTDLHLKGGPAQRPMTTAFPGKGRMILQRLHPPLLETPLSKFDRDVFMPNDQFFVRWHWGIPEQINVNSFRIAVRGAVIRRNVVGSVKAVEASRLAMLRRGTHRVSLDQVIETMRRRGLDMSERYKETSLGGFNVVQC